MSRGSSAPPLVALVGVAVGAYLVFGPGPFDHGRPEVSAVPSPTPTASTQGLTITAAQAGLRWAPARTAAITPGVQTYTVGSQCTANFVFIDNARTVYVGQAAHCAGTGDEDETDGCKTTSRPLGTPITFREGGSPAGDGVLLGKGTLAYSSWLTMRARGEKNAATCQYNDFALVKVATRDVAKVNPSVPFWGGPVGLNTTGTPATGTVYSYGNSSLRSGLTQLSPQYGVSRADDPSDAGWSHTLTSLTPGIPGDSGSAYLDGDGRALGTLSTLGLGIPVVNSIGDLRQELAYARAYSGIKGLKLVLATESFDSSRRPGRFSTLP